MAYCVSYLQPLAYSSKKHLKIRSLYDTALPRVPPAQMIFLGRRPIYGHEQDFSVNRVFFSLASSSTRQFFLSRYLPVVRPPEMVLRSELA